MHSNNSDDETDLDTDDASTPTTPDGEGASGADADHADEDNEGAPSVPGMGGAFEHIPDDQLDLTGVLSAEIESADSQALHTLAKPACRTIAFLIKSHPSRAPSKQELTAMHPLTDTLSTVDGHLNELMGVGVVEKVSLESRPSRDLPKHFFRLTEHGEELIEQHNLLPPEEEMETLRQLYSGMEKPEAVQRHEDVPRPWENPATETLTKVAEDLHDEEEMQELVDTLETVSPEELEQAVNELKREV